MRFLAQQVVGVRWSDDWAWWRPAHPCLQAFFCLSRHLGVMAK